MRLKDIKPGMVIHCKTHEEIKALSDSGIHGIFDGNIAEYMKPECYVIIEENNVAGWATDFGYALGYGEITEFSDLVIPELTAEEALRVFGEVCDGVGCLRCPFDSIKGDSGCPTFLIKHYNEAAQICAEWKSDNEKKEPEIETVDICRIIKVLPDGRKRCVHEEDIKPDPELPFGSEQIAVEEILKRYCMEHEGKFIAVHEVISRVKAVE